MRSKRRSAEGPNQGPAELHGSPDRGLRSLAMSRSRQRRAPSGLRSGCALLPLGRPLTRAFMASLSAARSRSSSQPLRTWLASPCIDLLVSLAEGGQRT